MEKGAFGQSDRFFITAKKYKARRAPGEMSLDAGMLIWGEIAGSIVKQGFVAFATRHDESLYLSVR